MLRNAIRPLTTLAAVALATAAVLAPQASASSSTLPQLRQQRAHVRTVLAQAKARARDAAADLAAARALASGQATAAAPVDGLPSPAPAPGPAPEPVAGSDLAVRLLADGVVTAEEVAALEARVTTSRHQVKRWTDKLGRLTRRIHRREQIARWAGDHAWRPLIRLAGEKYGVDPGGLYRMMMLESGGNPRVVGGIYNGLFQYTHSEWARHWNPWRHESIYDGWAQIRATALALSKGMGPGQWPHTYPMAF